MTVDAVRFEELARRALAAGDAATAREALALYGGELLPADRYEEWAETTIRDLIERIRSEEFAPSPEADCTFCSFRSICPRWPEGREAPVADRPGPDRPTADLPAGGAP